MSEKNMSMTEHLEELRRRLFMTLIGFVITFIIGFATAKPIIVYLQKAATERGLTLNVFRVLDPVFVYMQMAFVVGIVLLSPIILYQIWAFISPGLYKNEQRVTLSFIPISVVLFLLGIAFSYFILFPYILHFMSALGNTLEVNNVLGLNEYFRFLLQITLPFGIVFQLPILVMFLTRLGIITPQFLSKIRKYAYFVLLIIAGLVTPPDVISQVIVMVPLVILYEISIIIARFSYKKHIESFVSHER